MSINFTPYIIFTLFVLVVYVGLIIISLKNRDDAIINTLVNVVQGILWCLIAILDWSDRDIIFKIILIALIVLSFLKAYLEYKKLSNK